MPEIDFSSLHHAYLLLGAKEAAEEAVLSLFDKNGVRLKGSPDFFIFKDQLLGIDEARRISEQAIRRAFTERKIFFLAPEKITLEAQNALLKTLEEPIEHTHFFLCLREESLAIPTLRSRLMTVRLLGGEEKFAEARKFLALTIKERLAFVKKFVDNERDLSVFLDGLLLALRDGGEAERLGKAYRTRLFSDDRAASPRLILEHLSVVL